MAPSTAIAISSTVKFLSVSSSLKDDIRQIDDRFFWLLIGCTFLVLLGVILEEMKFLTGRSYVDEETGAFIPERSKSFAKIGLWILVVGIAGEGLFEAATFWVDTLSEDVSNSLLLNAEALTGNAEKSAKTAREEADSAETSAEEAQTKAEAVGKRAAAINSRLVATGKQLDNVESRRAELEKSLDNFAICNTPRVFTSWGLLSSSPENSRTYADPLKQLPSRHAIIEYDPDAEARRAANNIAQALVDAGWPRPSTSPKNGLRDGVEIDPFIAPLPTQSSMQDGSWSALSGAQRTSNDVADALVDFLHSFHWQARSGFATDDRGVLLRDPKIVPPDALLIKVGIYPAVIYIAPPGAKEYADVLAKDKEQTKRDRETAEKNRERQEAEFLKTLPPDRAAEYKQDMKEGRERWEKEERQIRERVNGPCQPLTPLAPSF